MGLLPGTRCWVGNVKFTKQKGFGLFNAAGYWRRKYPGHVEDEGWYLLTNLGTCEAAVSTFKGRMGREAMFKDCQTGGDNARKKPR